MPGTDLQHRKLVAIMFTDMVGYSAIARDDEKHALELLEEHQRILREIFPRFRGVEINTIGDAFLVEFASAVEAVECAVAIQQALRSHNTKVAPQRRIRLRIGLHVGDVVREAENVTGDAVNVAARIYPLAHPGGILLTEDTARQIRGKSGVQLQRMGTAKLKNVHPMVVHRVILPWESAQVPLTEKVRFFWSHQSARWAAAVLLLFAGAGIAVWQGKAGMRVTPAAASQFDRLRLVVLPFDNFSPEKEQNEYFAGGMTEAVISQLSQLSRLKVLARTSGEKYKRSGKSIAEIANELKVGSVIEGSVSKEGGQILIDVKLIDAKTQARIWSSNYTREFKGVFDIQSDVARSVASGLQVQLLAAETKLVESTPTQDSEAYDAYLRGLHLWEKRTVPDLKAAIGYFDFAVAKDPGFALSYVRLGDSYSLLCVYNEMAPTSGFPMAKTNILQALKLNVALSEAHASRALVLHSFEWDWPGAEREYREAIRLKSASSTAHRWFALYLAEVGRFEEALVEMRLAAEFEPYSPIIPTTTGWIHYLKRDYAAAVRQFNEALKLEPDFAPAHTSRGAVYAEQGLRAEALAEYEKAGELLVSSLSVKSQLGYIYAVSGDKAAAQKILVELEEAAKQRYVSAYGIATIYSALGNADPTFVWLNRALQERAVDLVVLKVDPRLVRFHSDPRFTRLLKDLRIPL